MFLKGLLLVSLVMPFELSEAACQDKSPTSGYQPDSIKGKYYLIAVKPAFSYQSADHKCVAREADNTADSSYPYTITLLDGSNSKTVKLNIKNLTPPGMAMVTGDNGISFTTSFIGILPNRIHVLYACNQKDGNYAVWVYNSKRVNGLAALENDLKEFVQKTLDENQIQMSDLKDIDNSNCPN